VGRGWVNAVREAAGAKKGRLFTKLAREITVAVKMGGANPDGNARLKSALREAQKSSMPKDTVERAIRRGTGEGNEAQFEEVVYEGYGPHGVAVLVEALTDNRNRTVQDLRAQFVRGGGNLGESGSVSWMFDRFGLAVAKTPKADLDAEEVAIHAGADSVDPFGDGEFGFWCAASDFEKLGQSLQGQGWELIKAEVTYKPKTPVPLNETQELDLKKFLELVDDNDDVKRVHLSV
jgi:YebC/PmpR family DNA-binding regulatory protein